jgi:phosphate starvation-inducible membrane PsiE
MLQAHSSLWHYLFVAPNVLLLVLAIVIWRRSLHKQFPIFVIFAVVTGVEQLTIYTADVLPSVSPTAWWKIFWVGLLLEALVKFALIGEIFGRVFGQYPSLAKLGRWLINAVGVCLVVLAALVAAYTPKDNVYWIVSGAHLLEQTIYMIESGLILFLFAFAAYFRLRWSRASFGITLGLGISACVHLATWALAANGSLAARYRTFLDFPIMATYHVCVLIWFYYLLIPQKSVARSAVPLPEHNLAVWNQELERLLHQ